MRKLWMQSWANIKKSKSVSITLAALFLISALLINSGLLVILKYGNFFNDIKSELNTSDSYFYTPDSKYSPEVDNYFKNNEHVKKYQVNKVFSLVSNIYYKDKDKSFTTMFVNMDEKKDMSKWKFVGEHLKADDNSVYVPDLFASVGGYKLNDKIKLKYKDNDGNEKSLQLTIKGFTEDVFFSSTDTGMVSFYMPEKTYEKVSNELYGNKNGQFGEIIFTNLDKVGNTSKVEKGLREQLGVDNTSLVSNSGDNIVFSIDISLITMSRTMMATMMAAMMVVFALVIVIVCLLVVRFRIVNSLDEDMLKIGSLKSVGYTNHQIKMTIVMQFVSIAMLGTLIGIGLSYPALPSVSGLFEQQSGLKWTQGFDVATSIITLLLLLIIVLSVVFIVSRKVKKLTPVMALRGENTEKAVTKNHIPLDKAKGNLSFTLAMKSVLQGLKHNIMIAVILVAVTFAGVFGVIMYYNTSIDTSAFEQVPGMEVSNAIAVLNPDTSKESVEKIESMKDVNRVAFLDESKVTIDDTEATCYIMDDFDKKKTRLVYEGRYPEKKGEIVLAGLLSDRLNKKVGDTVDVTLKGNKKTFKVCGLSQGASMGGINSSMLYNDFITLNPDFKQQSLQIYLKDGTDASKFLDKMKDELSDDALLSYGDMDKGMEEGMASYQSIVGAMGVAMLVITICVIALVLYFVISSTIIRKKRELGIYKAIGYTTFQLMNQMSFTFIIPILIGTALGAFLGAIGTNPVMTSTMKGMGIMKCNFVVNPLWVILTGIIILIVSYLLSLLITYRIRKISAYALVTE